MFPVTIKQLLLISASLQSLEINNLLFVTMDLPILDISYQWNHTIQDLLCLASFFSHNAFKDHPCCNVYHYFIPFLWLNNIPLYEYTTFCSSLCWLVDIWVVYTFCLLWIMLIRTFKYKYLLEYLFSVILVVYLGWELLGHMVILCSHRRVLNKYL